MSVGQPDGQTLVLKDGRPLGYAEYGDPTGLPLIGFHGMPASRVMMKIFDHAARTSGVHVIAPERPGYGLSQPSRNGTLSGYLQDMAQLVDAFKFERFAVMGVSGGGPFALACAHKMPERVAVAALVSGMGQLGAPNRMRNMIQANRLMFILGRFSPDLVGLLLPRMLKSSWSSLDKHLQAGTSPLPDIPPEIFALLVADQRESIQRGGKGVSFDMKILWQPWDFQLAEIQTQVLLFHGEADDLASVALARQIAEQLPNCKATFYPGEGHTGPLTKHSDEIMQALVGATRQ